MQHNLSFTMPILACVHLNIKLNWLPIKLVGDRIKSLKNLFYFLTFNDNIYITVF